MSGLWWTEMTTTPRSGACVATQGVHWIVIAGGVEGVSGYEGE